jgi:hypothetical protein
LDKGQGPQLVRARSLAVRSSRVTQLGDPLRPIRKRGKRSRAGRRQIRQWKAANVNQRSDDERYADPRYFCDLSPVHWLSGRVNAEVRPLLAVTEDDPEPDAVSVLAPLRPDALSDVARMRATRGKYLAVAREDEDEFIRRLGRHWRSAFDLLEIYVWNCVEVQATLDRLLGLGGRRPLIGGHVAKRWARDAYRP